MTLPDVPRGQCQSCHRRDLPLVAGRVQQHTDMFRTCPGSGERPATPDSDSTSTRS